MIKLSSKWRTWDLRSRISAALRTGLLRSRTGGRTVSEQIAVQLIGKVSRTSTGPDYERAVETAALYWDSVLAGRPSPKAKAAADRALSNLLGCRAEVQGQRYTLKDKILRAIA